MAKNEGRDNNMLLGWEPGQRKGLDILRSLMGDRAGEPREPGGRQVKREQRDGSCSLETQEERTNSERQGAPGRRGPRAEAGGCGSSRDVGAATREEGPSGRLLKGAREGACCGERLVEQVRAA